MELRDVCFKYYNLGCTFVVLALSFNVTLPSFQRKLKRTVVKIISKHFNLNQYGFNLCEY